MVLPCRTAALAVPELTMDALGLAPARCAPGRAGRGRPKAGLRAPAARGAWAEAVELALAQRERGPRDALGGFTAAISACGRGGQWNWAVQLLPVLLAVPHDPDVVCCSALIAACGPKGLWMRAGILLADMWRCRVVPNDRSYAAAISACERGQTWPQALGLLAAMCLRRVESNAFCHNAAVSAYEKGGQWMWALGHLREARTRQIQADVITHSAAVSACEKGGHWEWALCACWEMAQRGLQPNVVSCSAAISACCGSEPQWALARALLGEMRRLGAVPNIVSYNAAMHACEKAGHSHEALEILGLAGRARLRPTTASYGAALRACGRGGDWLRALRLWGDMRRGGLPPDIATCSFTVDACEGGGGPRSQSVQLLSELRGLCWQPPPRRARKGSAGRRVAAPKSETYQAYEGIDALEARGLLDGAALGSLGRALAAPALRRLLLLCGGAAGGAAGTAPGPRGWRLHEPVLEQQPGLGLVFTGRAVRELGMAGAAEEAWRRAARLASARGLGEAGGLARGAELEEMNSQGIVAWIAYWILPRSSLQATPVGAPLPPRRCSGRLVSFGAASGELDTGSARPWLVPVFREHDRSQHAERRALLAVLEAAARG